MRSERRSARSLVAIALLAAVALGGAATASGSAGTEPPASPTREPEPAQAPPAEAGSVTLPPGLTVGWYASIETSSGTVVARLLPEQAPQSVAWFAGLASGRVGWPDPLTGETRTEPYYDGLVVTKSVASDRFEAGERTEAGRNAPPFFVPMEGAGPVNFSRPGRLGRIRSSWNRISAVKFFVTAGTLPYLNDSHPCFGEVVSGLDVALRISEVRTDRSGMPLEPITIRRIRVVKVGEPPPLPEPAPHTPKGDVLGPREAPPPRRP